MYVGAPHPTDGCITTYAWSAHLFDEGSVHTEGIAVLSVTCLRCARPKFLRVYREGYKARKPSPDGRYRNGGHEIVT